MAIESGFVSPDLVYSDEGGIEKVLSIAILQATVLGPACLYHALHDGKRVVETLGGKPKVPTISNMTKARLATWPYAYTTASLS